MAQYYMQPILPQEALTGQYSVLHQERLYLLDALAEEENQGERLTRSLEDLQSQIHAYEGSNPPGNTKRLKQQVKSVRNRIGTCQHRERALALNLTNIVAQMETVKRYQWMTAQQDYAIQLQQAQQHAQMVLMSPARPAFALRSPANIDLAAQMQYMSLAPAGELVFGNRASLDPYMGTFNQSLVTPDLLQSFPEPPGGQFQPAFGPQAGINTDFTSSPMSATSFSCVSPTTQDWTSAKSTAFGRQRASSMLETVHEHQTSKYAPNSALRRLSLLDGSAALKLEREAAEERARGMAGWC